MKKILIILSMLCFGAYADTINLDWYKDGELYEQTTCEIGGGVTLPTEPTKYGYDFVGWSEIFNRGTFANWASVPTGASGYTKDAYASKTPQENDFIIVTDASDFGNTAYLASDGNTLYWNVEGTKGNKPIAKISEYQQNVGSEHPIGFRNANRLYVYIATYNYYKSNPSSTTYLSTGYYSGYDISSAWSIIVYSNPVGYSGTWLFRYSGTWLSDGKAGWIPEKQLD